MSHSERPQSIEDRDLEFTRINERIPVNFADYHQNAGIEISYDEKRIALLAIPTQRGERPVFIQEFSINGAEIFSARLAAAVRAAKILSLDVTNELPQTDTEEYSTFPINFGDYQDNSGLRIKYDEKRIYVYRIPTHGEEEEFVWEFSLERAGLLSQRLKSAALASREKQEEVSGKITIPPSEVIKVGSKFTVGDFIETELSSRVGTHIREEWLKKNLAQKGKRFSLAERCTSSGDLKLICWYLKQAEETGEIEGYDRQAQEIILAAISKRIQILVGRLRGETSEARRKYLQYEKERLQKIEQELRL